MSGSIFMDNCNLLVTRLFISAARKMYVQHKVYKDTWLLLNNCIY